MISLSEAMKAIKSFSLLFASDFDCWDNYFLIVLDRFSIFQNAKLFEIKKRYIWWEKQS